jgi:hypothetical protein
MPWISGGRRGEGTKTDKERKEVDKGKKQG